MHKNIEFYSDKNGKSEIIDYLKELKQKKESKDARIKLAKITAYINKLSQYGLELKEPYVKHIKDEIWELRPLRDRILFASLYNNKFILLSIFIKRTQKTPRREIEKAQRLLEDYKRRSKNNE